MFTEGQTGTNRSTRKIAAELNIHRSSVQQIAKHDLHLTAFCRVPAQINSDAITQKRTYAAKHFFVFQRQLQRCFSLTRKTFIYDPSCKQSEQPCLGIGKKRGGPFWFKEPIKFAPPQVMVSAVVCFNGKRRYAIALHTREG